MKKEIYLYLGNRDVDFGLYKHTLFKSHILNRLSMHFVLSVILSSAVHLDMELHD